MPEKWFVVRTKQAKEVTASCAIAAEGYRTFFPITVVEVSHARKRERKEKPLFPRYIFTQFDPEQAPFGKINLCRGVANKGLMCDAMDRPISIPDKVINDIRHRETAMKAKLGEVCTGYRPGDTFPIQVGPFAQMEATYVGEDKGKVYATVSMFGRANLLKLDFGAVPPCAISIDRMSA